MQTKDEGFFTVLYSLWPKPLDKWEAFVKNGHVKRITDDDIQSSALEIIGANVSANYITTIDKSISIKMPYLVLLVKNLKKFFTFEITIIDDKKITRKFKACNYKTIIRIKPTSCELPLKLVDGWNQVVVDLADFTNKAFNTTYKETIKVRRIYFTEYNIANRKIPPEYKVFAAIDEDIITDKVNPIAEEN